jgi:hypothetical protein
MPRVTTSENMAYRYGHPSIIRADEDCGWPAMPPHPTAWAWFPFLGLLPLQLRAATPQRAHHVPRAKPLQNTGTKRNKYIRRYVTHVKYACWTCTCCVDPLARALSTSAGLRGIILPRIILACIVLRFKLWGARIEE